MTLEQYDIVAIGWESSERDSHILSAKGPWDGRWSSSKLHGVNWMPKWIKVNFSTHFKLNNAFLNDRAML